MTAMLDYGAPVLWSNTTGRLAVTCQEQDTDGSPVSDCEFGVNWILMNNSQRSSTDYWLELFQNFDWTDGANHDGSEAGSQTQVVQGWYAPKSDISPF